ncbi:MAG: ankyrin repeat domain-containing protein [Candidatus Hydrogenedentes bacterium]|nr:ankyrin repeat domain-containing protein [Candidatus Hydrogenedentota bacterium]
MSLKNRLAAWFGKENPAGAESSVAAGTEETEAAPPPPASEATDGPAMPAQDFPEPASLHELAAITGSAGRIEAALEKGADPALRDSEGRTPLHIAAMNGNAELIDLLSGHLISVDPYDNYRISPLLYALRSPHPGAPEAATRLIAKGAVLTLNVAFRMGDLHLINRLFSENKDALKSCKAPEELLTDLVAAIRGACDEKIAARNARGDDAAVEAIESEVIERYLPVIHRVADQGVHPDTFDMAGRPALFEAIRFSSTVLAEFLLKLGADPDFEAADGQTPAQAAGGAHPRMQALFQECGAE